MSAWVRMALHAPMVAINAAAVLRVHLISGHLPPQHDTQLSVYRIHLLEAGLGRRYHLTLGNGLNLLDLPPHLSMFA